MIYVFKCENEECENFEQEVEIEQGMNDEHVADCELCDKEMKRVYTSFTIGVPQGNVRRGGVKIPASRSREMDRKMEQKSQTGGGQFWDNPNRRVK